MTYGKTWHEGRAVRHHNLVAATQPPITGPIDKGKGKSNTAGKGKGKPKSGSLRDDRLDALFASSEVGDWWWFNRAFMDTQTFNTAIRSVTGQVNQLELVCNETFAGENTPFLRLADASVPSTVAGLDCAYFDGIEPDNLYYNFGSAIAQPGTIIVALYSTDVATSVICTGSSASSRWQISNDSSDNIIAFAGATLDSTFNSPIGGRVLTVEFNGASTVFRRNGTQTATGNAGTQTTDQIMFGCLHDGTFAHEMYLFAALFIDRLLTTEERALAESVLAEKAGLTL